MTKTQCSALASIFLLLATIATAQRPGYVAGRLVDLRRYSQVDRPSSRHTFCIAIQTEDMSYLVDFEPDYGEDHPPKEFVVGDPIQVKVKGEKLWFIAGKRHPEGVHIVRRERISADSAPATCGK
jgi:hypothetical protein